jgi:transposase-like protein
MRISKIITGLKEAIRHTRKRCPKCHVGGYAQSVAMDGRPLFTCKQCGYTWTSGKSGKPYVK